MEHSVWIPEIYGVYTLYIDKMQEYMYQRPHISVVYLSVTTYFLGILAYS